MHSVFVIYIQSATVALIIIMHWFNLPWHHYHYKINIVYICVVIL